MYIGIAGRRVWHCSEGDWDKAKAHVAAKEGTFMKTRRMFLEGMLFAGAVTGLSAGRPIGQPQEFPRKPQTIELPPPDFPNPPSSEKRTPEENNKETRKKVDRLYQLATEMKAEVDKPDSANVLSLNLLKKAEEIEKLAHEIRKRSKG
jgi:hypothetical protein